MTSTLLQPGRYIRGNSPWRLTQRAGDIHFVCFDAIEMEVGVCFRLAVRGAPVSAGVSIQPPFSLCANLIGLIKHLRDFDFVPYDHLVA